MSEEAARQEQKKQATSLLFPKEMIQKRSKSKSDKGNFQTHYLRL